MPSKKGTDSTVSVVPVGEKFWSKSKRGLSFSVSVCVRYTRFFSASCYTFFPKRKFYLRIYCQHHKDRQTVVGERVKKGGGGGVYLRTNHRFEIRKASKYFPPLL